MAQRLLFTNDVDGALREVLSSMPHAGVFVVADDNTARHVLPQLPCLRDASVATIRPGDEAKTLDTLAEVWTAMVRAGATRHWMTVNVGGGVVTDLGGMAAATFKRGMAFVNVPTTLLGAVDAAVGGKTGINFGGLKNEVGVFCEADAVVVSTRFLATLPPAEVRSGFAEMLKHAMLTGASEVDALLRLNPAGLDFDALLPLLQQSVQVKERIVAADPREQGLRRALNLGHTVGHAFESHALAAGHPVSHGYAVAWGLVTELVLSVMAAGLPSAEASRVGAYVRRHYGAPAIGCRDYDALLALMHHDKKSVAGEINCTLLSAYGQPLTGQRVADEQMCAALDIFRDLMGL